MGNNPPDVHTAKTIPRAIDHNQIVEALGIDGRDGGFDVFKAAGIAEGPLYCLHYFWFAAIPWAKAVKTLPLVFGIFFGLLLRRFGLCNPRFRFDAVRPLFPLDHEEQEARDEQRYEKPTTDNRAILIAERPG